MKAEELFVHVGNISREKRAALANHARLFLTSEKYRPKWNGVETDVLRPFFTNADGRVFFIHSLPENIVAILMAMYSRLKNSRGIRGVFVDVLLPHLLAGNLPEVSEEFGGNINAFLRHYKISSLGAFTSHSVRALWEYENFKRSFGLNPDYVKELINSPKIKSFFSMWLDKFGHNSIARVAKITLCAEIISLLAAKSFEWTRPGSGYIELSTRYVDMSGKDLYPIQNEMAEFGFPANEVIRTMDMAFGYYRNYQGKNFNGPFPEFLRKRYGKIITDPKDLENGIIGESCDVLGNFLPCATLTSLGAAVSGEALSQILKHLILDGTPENMILVEMILEEASKIGADQFARHFEPTEWEKSSWGYLDSSILGCHESFYQSNVVYNMLLTDETVRQILNSSFFRQPEFRALASFEDIIRNLKNKSRSKFDKLPNHFESIPAVFCGLISFRSWRDLQRQQFLTHRSYVTPEAGFYEYDKPAPKWFFDACNELWRENRRLFDKMKETGIPPQLMQYPMALGNLITFQAGGNLLELEFCIWQRTKFSVNHEVRQIFLAMEKELRMQYPWWKEISRADMADAYIFARTKKGTLLV